MTHHQRVEEQLMFELFHAQYLLEHVVELLLRQDQLGIQGLLLHPRRPLRVLVPQTWKSIGALEPHSFSLN